MLDVLGQEMRVPRRVSLRGRKWKYRGEGNANLVLALLQERKIVRLRKNENGRHADDEDGGEQVVRETVFCRRVMVPLLGEVYIQPPAAAYMEEEEVRRLDHMLRSLRPAYRHHKGLQLRHITVYPDYALLPLHLDVLDSTTPAPTFCVEVKPKQGWIPPPERRLSKCTFCLNQYLKMKHGTVQSQSSYCPLDLFSGVRSRMISALRNLLLCPQNNLKIFQDGVLVYGDDVGEPLEAVLCRWLGTEADPQRLVERFCDVVYKALTRNLCTGKAESSVSWGTALVEKAASAYIPNTHGSFDRIPVSLVQSVSQVLPEPSCDWSAEQLPADCILDRILRIQKLEQSGADAVYHMYHSGSFGSSDYSYVGGLLNKNNPTLSPVHRYLLATTAKDCSIMMAFQRYDGAAYNLTQAVPPAHVLKDLNLQSYVFNVGVSDLDPKPLSCIEKHRKRDCEILSACLDVLGGVKGSTYNLES